MRNKIARVLRESLEIEDDPDIELLESVPQKHPGDVTRRDLYVGLLEFVRDLEAVGELVPNGDSRPRVDLVLCPDEAVELHFATGPDRWDEVVDWAGAEKRITWIDAAVDPFGRSISAPIPALDAACRTLGEPVDVDWVSGEAISLMERAEADWPEGEASRQIWPHLAHEIRREYRSWAWEIASPFLHRALRFHLAGRDAQEALDDLDREELLVERMERVLPGLPDRVGVAGAAAGTDPGET